MKISELSEEERQLVETEIAERMKDVDYMNRLRNSKKL